MEEEGKDKLAIVRLDLIHKEQEPKVFEVFLTDGRSFYAVLYNGKVGIDKDAGAFAEFAKDNLDDLRWKMFKAIGIDVCIKNKWIKVFN